MTTTPPSLYANPYVWTFGRFWMGFLDWMAEKQPAAAGARAGKSSRNKKASLTGLAMAVALLAAIGAASATLVPAGASALGGASATALAGLSVAMMALALLGMFVVVPIWGLRKLWRFTVAMAFRGWELETGRRVPIRRSV